MKIIKLFVTTLLFGLQLSKNFCLGLKPSPYQYGEDDGEPPASMNPTSTTGTGKTNDSSYTAGIQFMITRRMRRTLESELGYLETEVDSMEPQIAAVVIDRKLVRPLNGMPSSWKKSYKKPKKSKSLFIPITNFASSIKKKIQNIFKSNNGKQIIKYAVLLAVLILVAPVATQQLPLIGSQILKSLDSAKDNIINTFNSPKKNNSIRKTISDSSSNQNNNLKKVVIKPFPSTTTKSTVIEKPKVIKTQPITPLPLPPQIKINKVPLSSSSSLSSGNNKKSIDKTAFNKATSLTFLDRIVILRHIIIGK